MFVLLESNGIRLSLIQILKWKINEEGNFSDFGFISFSRLKMFKVFDTKTVYDDWVEMGSGIGQTTSAMRKGPFMGLQVILYLHAGTDLVQPIRVVRDSWVKG